MAINDDSMRSPGARLLARVDGHYFQFETLLNMISALIILGLMLLAVVQVLGRKIFNFPVPGYVDLVEFVMAVFCFIGIAYCQKLGGHIRMEFIIGKFHGRTLWFLEVVGTLIAIVIIAILMWYGYEHFLRAWQIGDSSINLELPIWPGKLLVAFAFATLIFRLLIQLAGYIRLFFHPDAAPIGVPIIETVDEQAQHEIDVGLAGEEEKVVITGGAKAEAG
jgi:TRAP-type C4-dicarboxylate transport system permease small subunit